MQAYFLNLKARVRESLPADAHLLYAKNDALYFVRLADENVCAVPGFKIEKTASGLLLMPDAEIILDFEARFAPIDFFSRSLERFRFQPATKETARLFAQGAKLLGKAENSMQKKYIQKVRECAAAALRTGNGGGIYAAARIASEITLARAQSRTR